jgi:hypothetical protein
MKLSFDPAAIDYSKRIQSGHAPLSRLRLTVVGKSGARHQFNVYTFSPFFEPQPRHYFTPCGRFVITRHVSEIDGVKHYTGQFAVFYNGVEIPPERFAIRQAIRESNGRQSAAYKRTRGADPSVTEAMRRTAMQQA